LTDLRAQRIAFAATSRLTEIFPVAGARVLDAILRSIVGSRLLATLLARGSRSAVRRAARLRRFLVIPDIHIGDAVLTQSALSAVRDFFPDAEVDYVINRTVAPLIEGTPEASRILPIFSGAHLPTADDVAALRGVIREGDYDLCWSFGSFLDPSDVAPRGLPFVSFMTQAPRLIRNENDTSEINHFSYQFYRFVRGVLGTVAQPVRADRYPGVRTTYSDEAVAQAAQYAAEAGMSPGSPVVMVNPDGACRFTLLPFQQQASLLERLAFATPPGTAILLGAGHSWSGVGQRLVDAVPATVRGKLRIIPKQMSLEAYAALMDLADVFITGDTGPLHLAAARRYSRSGHHQFRNRTAVLSLFGATVPRMSGYDSRQPGYLSANQDAPSWCYQAGSPCRNLSCLNKYFKTCRTVRCFEQVDTAALADLVVSYLAQRNRGSAGDPRPPARRGAPAQHESPAA
jgi:ADP-heptose:LPS heptosyltransferase